MKQDIFKILIFLIAISLSFRLLYFLGSGNPSYLVSGSVGIILLVSIFGPKYFFFDKLLPILIGAILFLGLILSYIYIFDPIYASDEFYRAIWVLPLGIIFLANLYYLHKDSESSDLESDKS